MMSLLLSVLSFVIEFCCGWVNIVGCLVGCCCFCGCMMFWCFLLFCCGVFCVMLIWICMMC